MRTQRLSQRLLAWLLALVMALACAPQALAEESAEAVTMQLQKTEGTVTISDANGKSVPTRDRLRLYSGYRLVTEEASYAWINLDSSKLVKEDAVSEISVRKSGKKLDILVDSGNLFFNVSEPLKDDESLNIRTSTMAVGIRGTCGWVKVIDQWTSVLYVLEGTVTVMVTDPVTGETKSEAVRAGETVTCKVYPQDKDGTKCDIIRQTYQEGAIEGFVLVELVQNRPLCEKIKEDSGLDVTGQDAPQKLKEDQDAVHKKLEAVKGQLESQENNISRNPVWASPAAGGTTPPEDTDRDRDSGSSDGGSSGGSSPSPAPSVDQELTMPQTDDTVNEYLARSDISGVTLLPGSARASTINMLEVDSGITVPAGKTLTLRSGVRMEVLAGQTVALGANARVTIGGAFISAGNLTGDTGATVRATGIESSVPLEDWKQSDAPDSAGYYTLTYSPQGVYTITFDANGGAVTPDSAQTGRDSRLTTLPTPTRTGYAFSGWFTEAEGGTAVTLATEFTQDTTIYAHWTAAGKIVITYDANGGTGSGTTSALIKVSPTLTTVKWDEIPVPTRNGYTFAGWYTEPTGGILLTTSYNVTASMTIYAHWTGAGTTCTITFNPSGGTVTPTTATTRTDGTLASLPTPTRTGYTFDGWFTAASGGTAVTTATEFTQDTTIYAQWTVESIIAEGNGWRVAGTTLYIEGNGTMESIDGYSVNQYWPWNSYKDNITAAIIGNGLTTVGKEAFSNCSKLTSVTIPNSVTSINERAFYYCQSLRDLTIPNSVNSISKEAFLECKSLTSVSIPSSVTSIGEYAFYVCEKLEDLTISNGVTSIGARAFQNCAMTSVTIPRSVVSAGEGVFTGCHVLKDVTFENGATSIFDNMFYQCNRLTNVTIPNSVTSIGNSAFYGCRGLTNIGIPNSVTSIGTYAFYECSGLTSVTIPDSISSVGSYVFAYCSELTSVAIPVSVTSIGDSAFYGCSKLANVYYAGTEAQWNSINIGTYNTSLTDATKHYTTTRSSVSYAAPPVYTDVPADAPYAEAVRYCKENGIMLGTTDATFSPDRTLTRAMMVTVLHRMAGKPAASASASFADVPAGKYYTDAVAWASGRGIVRGYDGATFGPDDPVTHRQAGLIFQRYTGGGSVNIPGAESPDAPATRAEIAVALMNCAKSQASSGQSAINVMCAPSGIARDQDGSLLVTDVYGKQLWRVRSRAGTVFAGGETVRDLYGQPLGGYNDARLAGSYFKEPWAIAPFLDGWAVSDTANNAVRLVAGSDVQTLNGATSEKLKTTKLGVVFDRPTGLAADDSGSLYVSDTGSGAVRKITAKGEVTTVAKNLAEPMGLCWKDGTLYIAEAGKNRIVTLAEGKVSVLAGNGSGGLVNGRALAASFLAPQGLTVGDDGSVYVADTGNGAVRKIRDGTVTTVAAEGLTTPRGLLLQGGSLYVCDSFGRKIVVFSL